MSKFLYNIYVFTMLIYEKNIIISCQNLINNFFARYFTYLWLFLVFQLLFLIITILAQFVIYGKKANDVRINFVSRKFHFNPISKAQNCGDTGGTTSIAIPKPLSYKIFIRCHSIFLKFSRLKCKHVIVFGYTIIFKVEEK